ncbi:hypothetical protein LXA43DRAFT_1061031 [Ganoderma leucocontextum]|nr:hypothetical protein LXA43DRAFT_1061031 [Ganoderma leucocontextum]
MKFIALPFVLLAGVAGSLGQSDFTVSVADHTQCASTEITWENGVGPYGLLAWIESDGAAVPVIDTGSLEVASYPLVNDAAAANKFTVEPLLQISTLEQQSIMHTFEPGNNTKSNVYTWPSDDSGRGRDDSHSAMASMPLPAAPPAAILATTPAAADPTGAKKHDQCQHPHPTPTPEHRPDAGVKTQTHRCPIPM